MNRLNVLYDSNIVKHFKRITFNIIYPAKNTHF